ncbi:MAG: SpoIID/LytB domain-containing protein [Oscillospiraceae bacterium]|nr:SpoIID/LytB domain-containing protein [Oscillospiraceae bacterium]
MKISGLLRLLILLLILTAAVFAVRAADKIRVGIYYGNNALPTANLSNQVGSGFTFGYYDTAYELIPVGTTDLEKITVCKDQNLYLSNGSFYQSRTSDSARLIGAYHLQTAETYDTYEDALAAAAAYPYGFPAYLSGKYAVRFEFYSTEENAAADASKYGDVTVVGCSKTCYTVVDTRTGDIIFEFDTRGAVGLSVEPRPSGTGEPQTWFKGYLYYGGFRYERKNGNDMTVVNIVPTDRYVAGVLPYEFVCSGGIESLKAGTVAIRTFAKATTKHQSLGFDVCTSTDCQVYHGIYSGGEAAAVEEAAAATSGQCLYYNGSLIQAVFYAANGGATESAANTWGGSYPYLIAQYDPYEDSISFASQSWSYFVTPAQVRTLLQSRGYSCGAVVSMEVSQWSDVGNVNQVKITDENGKVITFSKDNVRLLQNLSGVKYFSRRFAIAPEYSGGAASDATFQIYDGNTVTDAKTITAITATGTVDVSGSASVLRESGVDTVTGSTTGGTLTGWTLAGRGYGHNVGLSQWGAYAMAKQSFSYTDILNFYYPGATIG